MSKQLAISAAFSTFAMAAFALTVTPPSGAAHLRAGLATAAVEAQAAPALRLSIR